MLQPSELTNEQLIAELEQIERLRKINVNKLLDDEYLEKLPGVNITARGELFDTTKPGVIPTLVEKLYAERSKVKKEQLKVDQQIQDNPPNKQELEKMSVQHYNEQLALKILMNSLYGATSNQYFRYYDPRIAESITLSAQLTIKWAEKTINNYLNETLQTKDVDYIIAIDTDSLYINFGPFVEKTLPKNSSRDEILAYLDQLCKQTVEPILEQAYSDLKEKMNCAKQKMVMKREVIANKGIWTGKKHYIVNVLNSEGVQYTEPKLKMTGIEAVKSSTPYICRKMIKDGIALIMNGTEQEVQDFVNKCYEEFKAQRAEDIAFPRGVSDLEKYISKNTIYRKATPIHVRGALLFNHYLDVMKLDKKYQKINSAEKIKFVYLKLPNTIKENVIAFNVVLPDEFQLSQYIDYDTQFDKAFIQPIQSILSTINWSATPRAELNTLEEFF